jgi:hypothetical protein
MPSIFGTHYFNKNLVDTHKIRKAEKNKKRKKRRGGSVPPMENLLQAGVACRWLRMTNTTQAGNVAMAIAASRQ